jgi:hypothetical protein
MQRLLQGLEILNTEDDRGGAPVLGDHYPAVLALQPVNDLGEAVLHLSQGHLLGQHSHKYSQTKPPSASLRVLRDVTAAVASRSPCPARVR